MVLQCCVKGCETVARNGLHSFPTNKVAAERWVMATKAFHLIERLHANKLAHSYYKICRKHFVESDFQTNGKGQIVIKQESTPSLFLPNDIDVVNFQKTATPSKSMKPLERLNPQQRQHSIASVNATKQTDDDGMESDSDIDVEGVSEEEQTPVHNVSKGPKPRKVTNESRTLGYYKRRVSELKKKLKVNKMNDVTVLSYLATKFNAELMEFVSMQLKNCGRSKHGRRYTAKQKSLCLAMYKQGPKAYRFNESWCCLPTKRTLGRYSAKLIFKAGFDSKSLEAIRTIVKDWPKQDKYCTFGWDEVSLNEHLDYCQAMDTIEGFVEMCQTKAPVFATHALTYMVRGISIPYKQSVGYFYTNGLKSFELAALNKLMIERILTTGLFPILSVCDTCQTNASAVNELVHPNANQTKQSEALLQYKVCGHIITHVFDPSHLVKVVRNNFELKNIAHFVSDRWQPGHDENEGSLQIAAWEDVAELYRIDNQSIQRRLLKLTDEHLKPSKLKMRVSVATQIFSETCGTVMFECVEQQTLPQHCKSTAGLLLFINDLFDSINGSNDHPADSLKSATTRKSIHFEFWEYALWMLENMFFVDKATGARNNRSSVLTKFESTIRGYQAVARKCFDSNIPEVNIRDTTQDGLENFFGCVKSCNQSNKTTASQYRTGYTTMVINNITGTNSLRSNCQPDGSTAILSNIHEFLSISQGQPNDTNRKTNRLSLDQPELLGYANVSAFAEVQSETESLNSMILFDPEDEDDVTSSTDFQPRAGETSEFLETSVAPSKFEVVSYDATWVCQKLFRTTSCRECKNNFDLMDRNATLLSVERLVRNLHSTVAEICFQESLKAKLIASVQSVNIHVVGCPEHIDVTERKVKMLAVDRIVLSFCNNINKILSGKIVSLPDKPTSIQKLALQHRTKKRGIGKHSDIFE